MQLFYKDFVNIRIIPHRVFLKFRKIFFQRTNLSDCFHISGTHQDEPLGLFLWMLNVILSEPDNWILNCKRNELRKNLSGWHHFFDNITSSHVTINQVFCQPFLFFTVRCTFWSLMYNFIKEFHTLLMSLPVTYWPNEKLILVIFCFLKKKNTLDWKLYLKFLF